MSRLDSVKAKARALAQSGSYYGLPPLLFELSFEEGSQEAREWLATGCRFFPDGLPQKEPEK